MDVEIISRPYRRNDNRFVEQKNSALVRAYVGYQRLDSPAQGKTLAQADALMRLYYNLLQPVVHLVDKTYSGEPGSRAKVKRRYDRAATPFDRAVALGALDSATKEEWQRLQRCRTRHRPCHQPAPVAGAHL